MSIALMKELIEETCIGGAGVENAVRTVLVAACCALRSSHKVEAIRSRQNYTATVAKAIWTTGPFLPPPVPLTVDNLKARFTSHCSLKMSTIFNGRFGPNLFL